MARPTIAFLALAATLLLSGCGLARPANEPATLNGQTPLTDLPLRDRQPEAAAELSPELRDATPADSSDNRAITAPSGLSSASLSTIENAATIDGLSAWQNFRSGPRGATAGGVRSGASYAESAVRNLRIAPHDFAAETPGAGALLAVETRTGGDHLHGTLFGLLRESAWAATNPFSLVTRYNNGSPTTSLIKPHDALGQFGGRAGATLWPRRHLQAFAALEAQLRSDPIIATPSDPDFFRLTPMQTALLGTRGVTSTETNAALSYLDSLLGPVDRSSARTLFFTRLDAPLGLRDQLSATYTRNRFTSPSGSSFSNRSEATMPRARSSAADELLRIDGLTLAHTHAFPHRILHDLRFQFARDFESQTPRQPLAQEPAISPGGLAPQVSVAGFYYGTPAASAHDAYPDERRLELAETLVATRGHTVITLGGDWSRLHDLVATQQNLAGSFTYDSSSLNGHAGGLVDWITDYTYGVNSYPNAACPTIVAPQTSRKFCYRSYTQSFGAANTQWTTHDLAAFAQTTTRLSHRLQLTLGARWEYTLLPLPQNPNRSLDAALTAVIPASRRGLTSAFPEDRNNIAPRIALAYASRLANLHLAYGLFFGRLPGATVRAALANTALPNTATQIRITPTTEVNCPQNPAVGFGYPCAFLATPPAAASTTTSATVFANNFRLPAIQRATLTLDHTFRKRLTATLGYSGALATQLPGSVDLNLALASTSTRFVIEGGDGHPGLATGQTFAVPLYTTRLLTGYGPIDAITSAANATYHALNADLRLDTRSLTLHAAYTFSRAIDYNPRLAATPGAMTQFDPFRNGYDKGRSTLDFTHRFAASATYATPAIPHLREPLRRTLAHIRLSAIASTTSGAPYSYQIFGGTELTGGRETINGAGGATFLPTIGRNTLRLPPRGRVDLRLARTLALPHTTRLELFAEAFNLLNSAATSRVETRAFTVGAPTGGLTPLLFRDTASLTSTGTQIPAFGTPLSTTAGLSRERLVELGLHLTF